MKKLFKYFNNQISEKEDEEATKMLLQNHFDNKSTEKWEKILASKYKILPPGKNKNAKNNSFRKIGLIAASIMLLVFAGKMYTEYLHPNTVALGTQGLLNNYLVEKYEHTTLKKGPRKDNLRTQAIDAYSIGLYKKSISSYNQITNLKGEDFVLMGLSYLYNDQAEQAIPLLKKAIELVPFDNFRSSKEIRWQLSLAYLKNKQFDKAKIELEQLSNDKSCRRQEDAKKILETISIEE